jgi:hypothetical protein
MGTSMSRDESRRYTAALWYAVHEKDVRFEIADAFADWWVEVGWLILHDDIAAGFAAWVGERNK